LKDLDYIDIDKFYMWERYQWALPNGSLASIQWQHKSCSISAANLPSDSISRFCLIFDVNMLGECPGFVRSLTKQFGDIVWYYRLCKICYLSVIKRW